MSLKSGICRGALAMLLSVHCATAQEGFADLQLAPWAQSAWRSFSATQSIALSTRVNPFLWRGDFDGDGRPDLALLVVELVNRREGIVFLLQGAPPLLIGAGIDFGNGGDDFSWIDYWYVDDGADVRQHASDETGVQSVDALIVGSESSASAVIRIRDGRAVWEQAGD